MSFKTAAYIRLSREDGDKAESDSVKNQRELLHEFIRRQKDLRLIDTYIDDGWSGTDFKRPSFCRMIRDIEEGKIDCVIVKDLSRFGRDYLETGTYLERYFPEWKVRFISIVDGIDSEKNQYDLMMPIKNLLNEQYARDISKKVHAAVRTKQEAGKFIGAFASYGYKKSSEDKNKLIIDTYAAEVVRRIFKMYGEGYGKNGIARWLNDRQILSPSEYKRENGERYRNGNSIKTGSYWTYSTIHKILQNEIYIGNMVQGKKYQEMRGRQRVRKKEEWIVVEGTQEPIIDMETWERTQRILNTKTHRMGTRGEKNLFAGMIKCQKCGHMLVKKGEGEKMRYCCGTYIRMGRMYCTPHTVRYAELKDIISHDLEKFFPDILDEWNRQKEHILKEKEKKKEHEKKKLETEYKRVRQFERAVYEDFKEGILSKEEWLSYRESYQKKEKKLEEQILYMEKEQEEQGRKTELLSDMREFKAEEWMKKTILLEMIEEIKVGENEIEIVYRF
ncbi:MAG: recombinase family protein [Eubacteriales bacterium]|nr:recombinase family protein [Eubacteriales bacterium]